jgi:flavin reductase ActVB
MSEAELSVDALAAAVNRFPTGVTVIITNSDDGPVSLAVTAFSSVSVNPPLIMVCIPRSAGSFKDFQWAQAFGVSILSDAQADLARQFAKGGMGDFSAARLVPGASSGAPLILDAAAHLECVTYDRHAAGDHLIMVGEVVSASISGETPLVQLGGELGQFKLLVAGQ